MRTSLAIALALVFPCLAQPQQPSPPSAGSAKVWVGRYAEFEQFLKTARIVRTQAIDTGITRPVRVYFVPGGVAASAVMKDIDEGIRALRLDTYRSEIAAYELDKILGLDMVPPTVERVIDGTPRSVQLFVEGTRSLKKAAGEKKAAQDVLTWNREVYRMRVFDNLIVNIDRNEGNMLVDAQWRIVLIDHSRAFDGRRTDFQFEMTKIDRAFFEKLKALDKTALEERVHQWTSFSVDAILKQRDRIVKHFESLIAKQGEASVILQ